MVSMKDAREFVRAIHAGNFDAAGVFADWLEEQDDPVARERGKWLRRRWKRWQKERGKEIAEAKRREEEITAPFHAMLANLRAVGMHIETATVSASVTPPGLANLRFWRYVQKQFPLPEFKFLEAR